METDFGANVAGGAFGDNPTEFFKTYFSWFGLSWGWVVIAIMIVLIILVIAMMFGWIGTAAAKKEGADVTYDPAPAWSSSSGTSVVAKQRDGREALTSSALAQGYYADANKFCKGAGEDTTDPWEFMREGAAAKENLADFARPVEVDDQKMIAAMQGVA